MTKLADRATSNMRPGAQTTMYSLLDYDYDLPDGLIAQKPVVKRDASRLLFLRRKTGGRSHHLFYEICELLLPSDVLVINNTEVVPGRLFGNKATGGKVELLILDYPCVTIKKRDGRACACLIKSSKSPKPGTLLIFDQGLKAEVLDSKNGYFNVRFLYDEDFSTLLGRIGHVPLPPYIKRNGGNATWDDRHSYQTVYASKKGAIAAPTAGLHFSESLIEQIKAMGVKIAEITLHVGYGTFLPVREEDIRNHKIHSESFHIPAKSAALINSAKDKGGRVVAVGTTCVRTLENASDKDGYVTPGSGDCDLFIYPGYRFKVIDAMVTNFHLPRSTLLMLTAAFAGRKNVLCAYREAVKRRYRFYSYGDAMLIG